MIIIRCDRCGTEDDLHARILEVELASPVRTMTDTDEVFHLCGYCWSRVKHFITTRTAYVVEDAS